MALDEFKKDLDEKVSIDGFDFVIEKQLIENAKPIKIDFSMRGFKIDSNLKFDKSSCSGSCPSSGSCS